MRLPTCIIAAVLTFLGALLSGLTYHYKTHWAGPIVGFGVLSAGAQMGATLAISYALDCHKEVFPFLALFLLLKLSSLELKKDFYKLRLTTYLCNAAFRRNHGHNILSEVRRSLDLDLVYQ